VSFASVFSMKKVAFELFDGFGLLAFGQSKLFFEFSELFLEFVEFHNGLYKFVLSIV
jgi:hypothetical protein